VERLIAAADDEGHVRRPFVILSDTQIGSHGVIGDLLARTLKGAGFEVTHLPFDPAGGHAAVAPESTVVHNTIGPRLQPRAGGWNIALVHHEWSRYPASWVHRLNGFDEVWVTTDFVRRTLLLSGVAVPVLLKRPALDLEDIPRQTSYETAGPLRLLACGAPHFRKGFHLLMEGFMRAFPSEGVAQLVIHTSAGHGWTSPRADITIADQYLTRPAMLGQYREFDFFVSVSLGEGLGLPVAEAILAGVPVVTNDWGGHASLLTPGGFLRLPYRVVPQPYCSRPDYYAPGQECAMSRVSQIAQTLVRAAKTAAGDRRRMATAARRALLRRYGQRVAMRGFEAERARQALDSSHHTTP